ncbi:type VI secretion protein [Vibrio sp. RE86]|uniref:type VI secretion system protein TssA n=1 Tax=Vibrio sp. RE86 TaxID=2607605 RepID=UPI001493A444|nr:type VI secretion system ImpA family N-terminal domain-containing protein [Vibrio sp. RE86]NOH80002.1 type VI secretion protein [Vibrio sp. RE86]
MVDIESLLAPISEEAPTGSYLKLDRSIYRTLRNSYNTAQSSFRQLIETPDASSDEALLEANDANWSQLRQTTYDALTQSTKDLELLGWFIASQLFTAQPYQALADSTKVLSGLVDTFWQELHPTLPDNKIKSDDAGKEKELAEFRIKPLLQLVGESNDSTALFMPLQLIGLIDEITFGDYLRAERSGDLPSLKDKAQGLFSSDVEQTVLLLAESYQHFSDAETIIAQHCKKLGISPISFRFVKANIADSIKAIRFLVEDKFSVWPLDDEFKLRQEEPKSTEPEITASEPQATEETSQQTLPVEPAPIAASQVAAPSATVNSINLSASSQIASRDQAFQELRKLSEFFKATEPHSPISFLLERAIRWGYMSLPELLQEMTAGNSGVLQHINQLTGMDNLDKVDLAGKETHVPQPIQSSNVSPTPVIETSTTPSSSVELPNEESAPQQPLPTENNSTESASSLNDFEW